MKRVFKCRKCKYEFIIRAHVPEADISDNKPKDQVVPEVKIRCPKCNAELIF